VQDRRPASDRTVDQAARVLLAIAGALSSLVGFVLAVGGYLSPQEGSVFYVFAGVGLMVSGAMVARRHRAGAWTYMVVFAGALSWSLRYLDTGSSLALRLLGPLVLLVMMAVLMPVLFRWSPRSTIAVFALLIAGTVAIGIASLPNGPLAHQTAAVVQFLDAETKGVLQLLADESKGAPADRV
jgi:quinoprotein glucose dehydrogenase